MRYRVHYLEQDQRRTAEVDASSPQEAVIKFQHTRCDPQDHRQQSTVLSVMPEPDAERFAW
jgi:hypothetical protein